MKNHHHITPYLLIIMLIMLIQSSIANANTPPEQRAMTIEKCNHEATQLKLNTIQEGLSLALQSNMLIIESQVTMLNDLEAQNNRLTWLMTVVTIMLLIIIFMAYKIALI